MLLDTSVTAIQKGDTLVDSKRLKWKVLRKYANYNDSWVIERGPVQRIVFPVDEPEYSIFLNDQK